MPHLSEQEPKPCLEPVSGPKTRRDFHLYKIELAKTAYEHSPKNGYNLLEILDAARKDPALQTPWYESLKAECLYMEELFEPPDPIAEKEIAQAVVKRYEPLGWIDTVPETDDLRRQILDKTECFSTMLLDTPQPDKKL